MTERTDDELEPKPSPTDEAAAEPVSAEASGDGDGAQVDDGAANPPAGAQDGRMFDDDEERPLNPLVIFVPIGIIAILMGMFLWTDRRSMHDETWEADELVATPVKVKPQKKKPKPPAIKTIALSRTGGPWSLLSRRGHWDASYTKPLTLDYTEVHAGSDGRRLHLNFMAYDRAPDEIVGPEKAGKQPLWRQDCLDIFFGKSKAESAIMRMTISHTGKYEMRKLDSDEVIDLKVSPVVHTFDTPHGYELDIILDADSVGLGTIRANELLYMQVHRHFRGETVVPALTSKRQPLDSFAVTDARPTPTMIKHRVVKSLEPPRNPRRDVPKTPTPVVAMAEAGLDDAPFIMFPRLRSWQGDDWNVEQTEIGIATDGSRVKITARCDDRDPGSMVTEYTDGVGPVLPFKDDSLEFFFCPDPEHPWYYQICVSNTGVYRVYRLCNFWDHYLRVYHSWAPETLDVDVKIDEGGYSMTVSIDLKEIGMTSLKDKDSFHMQIVRNYRGQLIPGSEMQQLFPIWIYGDKEHYQDNHDRRAFAKVVVEKR